MRCLKNQCTYGIDVVRDPFTSLIRGLAGLHPREIAWYIVIPRTGVILLWYIVLASDSWQHMTRGFSP